MCEIRRVDRVDNGLRVQGVLYPECARAGAEHTAALIAKDAAYSRSLVPGEGTMRLEQRFDGGVEFDVTLGVEQKALTVP